MDGILHTVFFFMIELNRNILMDLASQCEGYFLQNNIERLSAGYYLEPEIEIMSLLSVWTGKEAATEMKAKFDSAGGPLDFVMDKSYNWTSMQRDYSHIAEHITRHDLWVFFGKLYKIYVRGETVGSVVATAVRQQMYEDHKRVILDTLCGIFGEVRTLIPPDSGYIPNKLARFVKIMLLPPPVDRGIWVHNYSVLNAWDCYCPLNSLLVKTLSEANIIDNADMTWRSAQRVYEIFATMFPSRPARGYYSLTQLAKVLYG